MNANKIELIFRIDKNRDNKKWINNLRVYLVWQIIDGDC